MPSPPLRPGAEGWEGLWGFPQQHRNQCHGLFTAFALHFRGGVASITTTFAILGWIYGHGLWQKKLIHRWGDPEALVLSSQCSLISIDWPVRVESSSISTQSSQALFSTWRTHFAWAPPFHCFIFSLVLISILRMHMTYVLNFRIPFWILKLVHLWHLLLSPFMFRSPLLQETAS